MSEVKWIKITTDIFDDEKIILIESLPDAYSIITVWFKLLCLAGKQNNSGVFLMNNRIAYTDKMLATIFRMKEATVTMALRTFEDFGMIEVVDGVITIPNWGKHQSLDQLESKKEYMRNYMKGYREKQKALTAGDKTNGKTNSKTNVSPADKEEDKDKEIDKDKKERKKSSYDEILSSVENDGLRDLYYEYIKMRKMIKAPMTDRALEMLVGKVNKLEPNSIVNQKKLLENAIMNNWKSVYPLKDDQRANPQIFRGEQKTSAEEYEELFVKPKVLPTEKEVEQFRKQIEIDYPDLEERRYEMMVESYRKGEWE